MNESKRWQKVTSSRNPRNGAYKSLFWRKAEDPPLSEDLAYIRQQHGEDVVQAFDEFKVEWKESDNEPFQQKTLQNKEAITFYIDTDITDAASLPLSSWKKRRIYDRILWLLDNAIPERRDLIRDRLSKDKRISYQPGAKPEAKKAA